MKLSLIAQSLGAYEGSCVDRSRPIVSELVEFAEYRIALATQQAELAARADLKQGAAACVATLGLCVKGTKQIIWEGHHNLRHRSKYSSPAIP
jgi:hypothetical protein